MTDGKQVKNFSNPTGTGKYLDERGQYVTVPGGGVVGDLLIPTVNVTLTANYGWSLVNIYTLNTGITLTLNTGSIFQII